MHLLLWGHRYEQEFKCVLGLGRIFEPDDSKIMNETSASDTTRLIRTPWGDLAPKVDLFPLVYLFLLYGVVYFLPFGLFDLWRKGEDGLVEWLQFLAYFGAAICAASRFLSVLFKGVFKQWIWWLLMALFCFYVAGEEISWGERLTGLGSDYLRQINAQGESNFHNLEGIQNYLHVSFIAAGVFLGWLGWRFFPEIDAFPARRFSLYFLIVAAFYFYWDVSWITHGDRIRNDQEAIELLMALGLWMHCFTSLRRPLGMSPGSKG